MPHYDVGHSDGATVVTVAVVAVVAVVAAASFSTLVGTYSREKLGKKSCTIRNIHTHSPRAIFVNPTDYCCNHSLRHSKELGNRAFTTERETARIQDTAKISKRCTARSDNQPPEKRQTLTNDSASTKKK